MKRVEIEELRFQMQGPESWLGGECVVVLCDEIVRLREALVVHDPLTCPCCRAAAATLDPESFERFEARRDRAEALLKEDER